MTTPYPPWAKWIAQDRNGDIVVSDCAMFLMGNFWLSDRYSLAIVKKIAKGKPNPHWRDSLDCLGDET